jgi:putative ABC transport system permease protein
LGVPLTAEQHAALSLPKPNIPVAKIDGWLAKMDPEIFEIFSFEWLQGDPVQALAQPFTIVLSESTAAKYFGDENPMGQTLLINNQSPLTVTGVIADLPDNTHLSADLMTAMSTGVAVFGEQALAGGFNFHSYVRIQPNVNIDNLISPMTEILRGLIPGFGALATVAPFRLVDIHFTPLPNEMPGTPGSMSIIYTFSAIAFGILLIACINFMNLSTARSSQRAKEVGMRKTIGAEQGQLIRQFIGE